MTFPGGISQPTIPGGSGQGVAYVEGVVTAIDTAHNKAVVMDQLLKSHELPLSSYRPKGLTPKVGERWILHKQFGKWFWAGITNGSPEGELDDRTVTLTNEVITDRNNASSYGDLYLHGGDFFSTCARREMTNAHATVNQRMHCFRTYSRYGATVVNMKIGLGTARVGGDTTIGFYMGSDSNNLPLMGFKNAVTSTAVQVWGFGSNFIVPAAMHIVYFVLVTGAPTTMPTLLGPPPAVFPSLINRGVGRNTSFYKDGITSAPSTINMNDGSWSLSASTCWMSLATG